MSSADDPSCSIADCKPSYSDENTTSMRKHLEINIPEKILFVIDTVKERNCTPFKLSGGGNYMPLFMIKRIVQDFVSIKSIIQRSHEYGLMILDSHRVQWVCDFTNNINVIINHLNLINDDCIEEQKSYDLGQLFDFIQQKLYLPKRHDVIPMFVNRVILLYSRSNSIPKFHNKQSFDTLTLDQYFFVDTLYVHEPPSQENLCEQIYALLASLDTTGLSYILEVGRNAAKLHDCMAKLLAHPLQRAPQTEVRFPISPPLGSQEMYDST